MYTNLHVTLWPSFPHFQRFASDDRIDGIRLNSAMTSVDELDKELTLIEEWNGSVPLHFDVKGRQLRITEVIEAKDSIKVRLNHAIRVPTPTTVLFKAGADHALLEEVSSDGTLLTFAPGRPRFTVRTGESIHIRHNALEVLGPQFTEVELAKIEKVKAAGCKSWYLSYTESQEDVDEFVELVGRDAEVSLKIESKNGLEYVARDFQKRDGLRLVAARGDLYVEVDRPHDILAALKMIIEADSDAIVGSRILLSVVHDPVPSCADFTELAWLHDIGYRQMLLCDELCLKGDLLATAVGAFEAFRNSYGRF